MTYKILIDGTKIDQELELEILRYYDFKCQVTPEVIKQYHTDKYAEEENLREYKQFILKFCRQFGYSIAQFLKDIMVIQNAYAIWTYEKYFHLLKRKDKDLIQDWIAEELCYWKDVSYEEIMEMPYENLETYKDQLFERADKPSVSTIKFRELGDEVRFINTCSRNKDPPPLKFILKNYCGGNYEEKG